MFVVDVVHTKDLTRPFVIHDTMPLPSALRLPRQIAKRTAATPDSEGITAPSDSIASSNASLEPHVKSRLPLSLAPDPSSNPDRPKRRSFLPQRGDLKMPPPQRREAEALDLQTRSQQSVRAPADAPTLMHPPHTRSRSIQTRLRPQSMYQTGGGRVGSEPEGVPMQVAKGPDPMRKSSTASSTGLQRSQSLRRPGAPLQPTQPGGHKRTQSTSTGAGARKGPAEARVIAERPQSLLAAPGHIASNANNASTEPITGTTRSSARLAGLQRSTSTRTKREVTERAEATGAAVRPVKADMEQQLVSAANAKRREATQDETKKIGRPAFSTLQQHFTPKKGAKPPTSAFLHPAPDVGLQALPSETASLQAELLQLHLLHSEAERTARQWELSAERTLLRRFDHVVSLYRLVRDLERQDQENKNVRALCEWSSSDPSSGLMEHIQLLAGPLHELPSLVDNEGRFTRLVGEFDRWKAWVEDIWSTRANGEELRGGDLRSAEGLGDSWKADQAALTRKLTSFTHDLDRLTQPSQGSSIACVVSTCKELLQGLADELQIMEKIEADLVVREKAWVEMRLGAIARDIGSDLFDPSPMIEAWRT